MNQAQYVDAAVKALQALGELSGIEEACHVVDKAIRHYDRDYVDTSDNYQDDWIAVKDRSPKLWEPVLICIDDYGSGYGSGDGDDYGS